MIPTDDPCALSSASCDRREFLSRTVGAVAAALVLAGWTGVGKAALPVRTLTGRLTNGAELALPLPTADGVTIDHDHSLILVRTDGQIMAFALSCPHQRTALKWNDDQHRFQCPRHKSQYQPDGTFISGRATRAMDRYPLRRDGGEVVVSTDQLIKQDQDPTGWSRATLHV